MENMKREIWSTDIQQQQKMQMMPFHKPFYDLKNNGLARLHNTITNVLHGAVSTNGCYRRMVALRPILKQMGTWYRTIPRNKTLEYHSIRKHKRIPRPPFMCAFTQS
ncbi:hypothetical protein CDAR_404941 [Caerostris darwini]|uniref:Uncharacterized protein n=1 Tax=Caerostris darwini TaxID=1538125 RepID=A0AAV4U6Q4_9ARAC|nr:hypothetical protein CDAR_404941 [Caerostris darwini]